MNTGAIKGLRALFAIYFWLTSPLCGSSQILPNGGKAHYTLIHGSSLSDACPICGRPTIQVPMTGSCDFRLISQGPLFLNYAVENVSFSARQPGGSTYTVSGQGTYRIGGELAVQQDLALTLMVDDGTTNISCQFTAVTSTVARLWPMVQMQVIQTNNTPVKQYTLTLNAAPLREIWFSTVSNFQASIWQAPSNTVGSGDLLSSAGRVVKRNGDLVAALGVQPQAGNLGLNDVDILADGEIVFSIEQKVFSATLGQLSSQDLLSDRGRLVQNIETLTSAFVPTNPVPTSLGLTAIQLRDNGEIYFAVQNAFWSAKLGRMVQPGDLLSDSGVIVRSGPELLAAFAPQNPNQDVGLSSVYVWPNGEIWFSTRDGFGDTNGTAYGAGDLLSDQGYVVYKNLELLAAFSPGAGTTNDVGLDALFVISDVTPVLEPVSLTALPVNPSTNDLTLTRAKGSRVFQLEAANDLLGPFKPTGSLTTDRLFTDLGAVTNQARRVYRLHQW